MIRILDEFCMPKFESQFYFPTFLQESKFPDNRIRHIKNEKHDSLLGK